MVETVRRPKDDDKVGIDSEKIRNYENVSRWKKRTISRSTTKSVYGTIMNNKLPRILLKFLLVHRIIRIQNITPWTF